MRWLNWVARHGRLALPCFALFIFILAPSWVLGGEDNPYLSELKDRAERLNLHSERYWEILLHYKPAAGGVESLIDDPAFFLAANGKKDPRAELKATLEALFRPPGEEGAEAHPRCRFVARTAWLEDRLGLDQSRLPQLTCEEFEAALEKVQPRKAVLIFPGTHQNSPASMFGHTLLGIEGPYRSKLLSYAINYSAYTTESNGFAYAINGIFGLYRGYFSVLPYYQKLREYRDLERRDVWEYPLNLSREEVTRLFLHIWELKNIHSDYFFFDENCAYNLLFLVEAARPEVNLTDQCRPWVIPIDTVRILRESSLIERSDYRPSKATRIAAMASRMSREEEEIALEIIRNDRSPSDLPQKIDSEGRIRILDVAAEMTEYHYFRKELSQNEYRVRYRELLAARSRLGQGEEIPIHAPVRPDLGHGSNRVGLGAGWWKRRYFQELRIRPAYHNLLDEEMGYSPGSQIDFFNLVLRYYPSPNTLELQSLDLINIVSLSPRTTFFRPISWKVETGFLQRLFPDEDNHLIYQLNPGGGFTWGNRNILYTMLETDLLVGGRFRDGFAWGAGGTVGGILPLGERTKIHLSGRKIYYELGDPHRRLSLKLGANYRLTSDQSLQLKGARHQEFNIWYTEGQLSWNIYW